MTVHAPPPQPAWVVIEQVRDNQHHERIAWAINCAASPRDSVEASTLLLKSGWRIEKAHVWAWKDSWAPPTDCRTTIKGRYTVPLSKIEVERP